MQCSGQDVTGIAAFLDFDPTCLEVKSITKGSTLDTALLSTYDNVAGTIDYSAGIFTQPFFSDTFTVATITFSTKVETTGTSIGFHKEGDRTSDVDFSGTSKLNTITGAMVTINDNDDDFDPEEFLKEMKEELK